MFAASGMSRRLSTRQIMISQGGIAGDIRVTNEHWDVDFACHLLERSYHAALHLTFLLDNIPWNRFTIDELDALIETAMTNHRARIWSLVVGRAGVRSDISNHLLRAQFPDLHHLTIGPDLARCPSLCVDDLSDVTPSLTTLSLASSMSIRSVMNGGRPIFLNVTRLELIGSSSLFDTTVVSWDFTNVVARLPALKVIVFADYFPESPQPSGLQPIDLPADMESLEFRSNKPAYSIMSINSLLEHNDARRVVGLARADPRTLATVFSGALDNFARWVNKGKEVSEHSTGEHQGSETDNRNYCERRTGHRRITAHYLSVYIRIIPHSRAEHTRLPSARAGLLTSGFLTRYAAGPSAQEFLKVFEQDARRFPALREVYIANWQSGPDDPTIYVNAAETLLTALKRRQSKGMPRLNVLHVPWSHNPPSPTLVAILTASVERFSQEIEVNDDDGTARWTE
ncbi:hypothetical protein K488DRAFT_75110 [Vararia minispora EC-137]|uniref:Uncharacterized protein n=1 Tax=Vararia minispora EC-137 TaxID=1314806 RepID=A0ACB8Q4V5_9AGAM|nr:hypothetical protein K488DRAFT_75110 [Vararia minispora EC-137]